MEEAGPFPAAMGWIVAKKANGTKVIQERRALHPDAMYNLKTPLLASFAKSEKIQLGQIQVIPRELGGSQLVSRVSKEFRQISGLPRFQVPLIACAGRVGMAKFMRLIDLVWQSSGVFIADHQARQVFEAVCMEQNAGSIAIVDIPQYLRISPSSLQIMLHMQNDQVSTMGWPFLQRPPPPTAMSLLRPGSRRLAAPKPRAAPTQSLLARCADKSSPIIAHIGREQHARSGA